MNNHYRKASMVNWFEPRMLFQTAIKVIVSTLFGNYADKREMEAALGIAMSEKENKEQELLYSNYIHREEIWFDFISDTGDGFNSTYSIAVTAAADQLHVENENGQTIRLPRGKILIMGGDQIYPTPTNELYNQKFRIPFKAAFPEKEHDPDRPHMYAIPGNHDWYDGLGNFLKVFCQSRWIGNWETHQKRSYFALPLPHNYWVWAIDIQLNEDIDEPQKQYFIEVGSKKMKQDDKVILITAEPAWIYKELNKNDKSYDRLKFFIETYITEDKAHCINKTFNLVAVITGDLHHYSHYCSINKSNPIHYIGAGGGGAFLHLTHNLPDRLDKVEEENKIEEENMDAPELAAATAIKKKKQLNEKNIHLQSVFPNKSESKKLLLGNFGFFYKNYFFSFLLGILYFIIYWLIQSSTYLSPTNNYMVNISKVSFLNFISITAKAIVFTPSCIILSAIIIYSFYKFTDTNTGKKGIPLWGLFHGLLQCLSIFFFIWLISSVHNYKTVALSEITYYQFIFFIELILGGGILGGLIMGAYLYFSSIRFKIHLTESSSSLRNEDYKCFLRMHLNKEALTIYPIAIRKVTKNWVTKSVNKNLTVKGKKPKCELIDKKTISITHN